jgi:hypothetical protein
MNPAVGSNRRTLTTRIAVLVALNHPGTPARREAQLGQHPSFGECWHCTRERD